MTLRHRTSAVDADFLAGNESVVLIGKESDQPYYFFKLRAPSLGDDLLERARRNGLDRLGPACWMRGVWILSGRG